MMHLPELVANQSNSAFLQNNAKKVTNECHVYSFFVKKGFAVTGDSFVKLVEGPLGTNEN